MIEEKLNYIHNNPVEEGCVNEAQEYFFRVLETIQGLKAQLKLHRFMMEKRYNRNERLWSECGASEKHLRQGA
jgi:hypothetical protein